MPTFVIANQKGGTGKTTTAITLAHRLVQEGLRVLIVDTDVQGQVSTALGLEKAPGIYRLVQCFQGLESQLILQHARPNLDVLPSDKSTGQAKVMLTALSFREQILAEALARLSYDVTVIDCAPSVDVLHIAALAAADWLIIPTRLDALAIDGVRESIASLVELKRRGQAPRLLGVLPTFLERRTNETAYQYRQLVQTFEGLVLPPIPDDVKLREAPAHGRTIWEYAPATRGIVGLKVTVPGNGSAPHIETVGGYARLMDLVKRRTGL